MRGGWPDMRIITSQGMTNAWSRYDKCLCGQVCLSMTGDPWVWSRGAERRADRAPQSRQAGPPMPWRTWLLSSVMFFISVPWLWPWWVSVLWDARIFSPLFLFSAALHWNRPFGNKPSLVVSPPQWFSFGFIKRISSSSSICPLSQGIDWYLLI